MTRLPYAIACLTGGALLAVTGTARAQEPCFERLDNGFDTTGWQPSPTSSHGPGLGWTFEDGALVGRQTDGQLGGLLMTSKSFRDVEVRFEVQIDWGCDSGVFFRTTAGDHAYQITLDYLTGGAVGCIWGENFASPLNLIDYGLTDRGARAFVQPGRCPLFDLAAWPGMWNPTGFNEVRVRIEGNPPRVQAWVSSVKTADFTDGAVRRDVDAAGPLGLQVHSGPRWVAGGAVRFRNFRAWDLTAGCVAPADAGDARASGPDDAATNPNGCIGAAADDGRDGSAGCGCRTSSSRSFAAGLRLMVFGCLMGWLRRTARPAASRVSSRWR